MKKLILVLLLVSIFPLSAFSDGAINCSDLPYSQCRNSCLDDENVVTKVKVMSGEHKNEFIHALCNMDKIDPSKVCCAKKISPADSVPKNSNHHEALSRLHKDLTETNAQKGCCFFKNDKGIGCVFESDNEGCQKYAEEHGSKYAQFKIGVDCTKQACYNQDTIEDLANKISNTDLISRGIRYPSRVIVNDNSWFTQKIILNSRNVSLYVLIIASFLLPIFILAIKRNTYSFISIPLTILASLIFGTFVINLIELISGYQYYFLTWGDYLFSISNVVSTFVLLYATLYFLIAPTYHYYKFKQKIMTDQMLALIKIIDAMRTKTKF